ncbi:BA75_02809T0 [Komagataella pastoris]|uniref:BA75_02809T0 n=1 Tax=Komagataella pastoris TaxID=4922 RepID=A0A1B2JCW0_PICPA|nr:BA75_02809T0 [Komagataella pastoris]
MIMSHKQILISKMSDIVKEFLLSKSSFEHIISRNKFTGLAKKNCRGLNPSVINILYESLRDQKNEDLQAIKASLDQDPRTIDGSSGVDILRDTDVEVNKTISLSALENVVDHLKTVEEGLDQEIDQLQKQCDYQLGEIESMVDQLSDLKYGNIDFLDSIDEVVESLKSVETKIMDCQQR